MKQITEITDYPNQKFTVVTETNESFELKLQYSDVNQGWFYSLNYDDLVIINNARVVTSANMLRNFKNQLPFGLSAITNDGSEPIFVDDFSTGRVSMFLLNESDVAEIEQEFYNN